MFYDNESENIRGESIGGAALILGRRSLTFLSHMGRLFEGGAYLSNYGIKLRCDKTEAKNQLSLK